MGRGGLTASAPYSYGVHGTAKRHQTQPAPLGSYRAGLSFGELSTDNVKPLLTGGGTAAYPTFPPWGTQRWLRGCRRPRRGLALPVREGLGSDRRGPELAQQHVYQELEASIAAIVQAGSVFEIRLLGSNRKRVDAGYFNSPAAAATALSHLDGSYQGIYITPNPVQPDLLARSANRITPWAQVTSMDPDVTRRYWLLVDIDPVRPSGISSTDAEHDAAHDKARQVMGYLSLLYGFCEPMYNDSGNGAHLLYPINEPNTVEVRDAVHKFLKCLSAKFSTDAVKVDTTVFNAARIWRVPGTWSRKGDSVPDRPHRKARIVQHVHHLDRVTLARVYAFIAAHETLLAESDKPAGTLASKAASEYPADERKYKMLNDHAMRRIPEWVPNFFPDARPYKEGYRISSQDLGRIFEEDLTIHPYPLGIKDFAVADQGDAREGRRTPVSLIAEFCNDGDKEAAAQALADVLKAPVTEFTPIEPASVASLPGTDAPRPRFNFKSIRSLADLQQMTFSDTKFVIPGVLPVGNVILSARPKMRKTWLALQLGMAVSTGGKFLEWECSQGDVLFLALEDNERRLKSRIRTLQTFNMIIPDLSGFRYWTGGMSENSQGKLYVSDPQEAAETLQMFPRGEAGVDALEQYLEQFPKTTMIVIDTLQHFRGQSNNRDVYARDYEAMMPITKLAARKQVLIMPVTHDKKGLAGQDSADFMEDVTGSAGNTGGADGVMAIKGRRGMQEENESRKLLLSGRDIPHDYEVDMTFDAERGGWLTAARQDVKVAVRAILERHPYVNQQELAALLPNVSKARITKVLTEMKFQGEVTSTKFGYQLARPI